MTLAGLRSGIRMLLFSVGVCQIRSVSNGEDLSEMPQADEALILRETGVASLGPYLNHFIFDRQEAPCKDS